MTSLVTSGYPRTHMSGAEAAIPFWGSRRGNIAPPPTGMKGFEPDGWEELHLSSQKVSVLLCCWRMLATMR